MALLNHLYTCFDEVSDKYDVYKVKSFSLLYLLGKNISFNNNDNNKAKKKSVWFLLCLKNIGRVVGIFFCLFFIL